MFNIIYAARGRAAAGGCGRPSRATLLAAPRVDDRHGGVPLAGHPGRPDEHARGRGRGRARGGGRGRPHRLGAGPGRGGADRAGRGGGGALVAVPPVLAAPLALLHRLRLAGGGGRVAAGGPVRLPLALPHLLPAALALGRRGEGEGGAGAGARVREGDVGGLEREVLGVVDHLDVVLVQPVRPPRTPLAAPVSLALILPNIFTLLKIRVCFRINQDFLLDSIGCTNCTSPQMTIA